MIISGTLEYIADKCSEWAKGNNESDCFELFKFVKVELQNDNITRKSNYESFWEAFNNTIPKTPNKKAFVDSEIDATRKLLGAAINIIPNRNKVYDSIYKLVLVGKPEFETVRTLMNKYLDEGNFSFIVRIIYSAGLIKYLCFLEGEPLQNSVHQEPESKVPLPKPEISPQFKPEAIQIIFDILKPYFPNQHIELKQVLDTGNVPPVKLLFYGSGKILLDFFKQLMQGQFLTIAVQRDLEKWISKGFEFLVNNERKPFTQKYASKIISGSERAAKGNRLIDIQTTNGKLEIIQLRLKNRVQEQRNQW